MAQALELRVEVNGANHPDTIWAWNTLAEWRTDRERRASEMKKYKGCRIQPKKGRGKRSMYLGGAVARGSTYEASQMQDRGRDLDNVHCLWNRLLVQGVRGVNPDTDPRRRRALRRRFLSS